MSKPSQATKAPEKPIEAPKPMTVDQWIKIWFTNHPVSEEQQERHQAIRKACMDLGQALAKNMAASADQTACLRKLREIQMIAVQNVTIEEVVK